MELVNIGGQSWVNPEHVVAVEITQENPNKAQIYFQNGTSAITGLFNAGAVVAGLVSISRFVWVRPEALVSFTVKDNIATLRTVAGPEPEFQVEIDDEAHIAQVLDYFERGGVDEEQDSEDNLGPRSGEGQ